jgi:hypothetical protein
MMTFIHAVQELLLSGQMGSLVLPMALLCLGQIAIGLGRSRQWYMLPIAALLLGLVGFLINPLADASSLIDLKNQLTSYETLTLLCVCQFMLVSVTAWLNWQVDETRIIASQRSAIGLAWLAALPAPAVVVAMLLIEQVALTTTPQARPEAVGWEIGLAAAGLLLAFGLVAFAIPPRYLAFPQATVSAALLLSVALLPFLESALPESNRSIDWNSLSLLAKIAPIGLMLVAVGYVWQSRNSRKTPAINRGNVPIALA